MSKKKLSRIFLVVFWTCFLAGMAYGQGVYEAWVARYNGPANSNDEVKALAVDGSGNVYVTGISSTEGGFSADYATIKYNPNGDTVWVRRYNGPGNGYDQANALALDAGGNVYVTGGSSGSGTSADYITLKYGPNGDTIWIGRYNGPSTGYNEDVATALAIDDSSNVYVTGRSFGSESLYDYATIKYALNGDTLWVRRYSGPAVDEANALAVDDSGNVYVTGSSYAIGTNDDYATIKYAPNGDTLWVRRYNGPGNGVDAAYALAVDASGYVYVTGHSRGSGTDHDYATIKYAPNGDTLWVRRYNGPGNFFDAASALALDASGNVYVTGGDASGTSGAYATIKYNPNGDTVWVRRYNGPGNGYDQANALAVDTGGNIYVTGYSWNGTSNDYATIKYAPNGDPVWVRRFNGPGNGGDEAKALAVDGNGNVYVTGYSKGSGTDFDFGTIKYSPCSSIPGDVNASGAITIGDIIHSVNYIFDKDKLPCLGIDPGNCWTPDLFCRGDVNISGAISLGDIIHLVNYIFDKDQLPCLGSNPGNCWTPEASGACCLAVP